MPRQKKTTKPDPSVEPSTEVEYEYLGQPVKITRINPFPSTDFQGKTTTKYQVWIETRLGHTADLLFDDLSLWKR